MELLAGLALFLLGGSLLAEGGTGLALRRGRRLLLRAEGLRAGAVAALLGALTGSGTGLTLLGQTLYRLRLLPLREGALLGLGGTFGATALVALAGLARPELGGVFLGVGALLDLLRRRPWALLAYGLGLLFLGVRLAGAGAAGLFPLLEGVGAPEAFLLGLLLSPWVGSANLFALLALALLGQKALSPEAAGALVLAAGVGATGPLWLVGGREGMRLGVALGLHRLLLALLLYPLLALRPGVVPLHALYHGLALLLYPLLHPLWEALALRLLPEPKVAPKYLRPEALASPPLARALALRELARVGDAVAGMLRRALEALAREEGSEKELEPLEDKVDRLARELLLYAAALEGEEVFPLLVATSEVEHLGDLAKRVLRKAEKLWGQGLAFSAEGQKELVEAAQAVLARLELLNAALATGQEALAQEVLRGREGIRERLEALRRAHLERLRAGRRETQASTLTHLDLLITLEELDRGLTRLAHLVPRLHGRSLEGQGG